MNLLFLILIGIPLALYLIILIFNMGDFSPDGSGQAHAAEPPRAEPEIVAHETTDEADSEGTTAILETAVVAQETVALVEPTLAADESNEAELAAIVAPAIVVAQAVEPETVEPIAALEIAPVAQETPAEIAAEVAVAETEPITLAPIVQPIEPAKAAVEPPQAVEDDESQPILSGQPLILPDDAPKYAFDYRGRLWVEKKRRGFFRQLRRPQLPPDDPSNNSNR